MKDRPTPNQTKVAVEESRMRSEIQEERRRNTEQVLAQLRDKKAADRQAYHQRQAAFRSMWLARAAAPLHGGGWVKGWDDPADPWYSTPEYQARIHIRGDLKAEG